MKAPTNLLGTAHSSGLICSGEGSDDGEAAVMQQADIVCYSGSQTADIEFEGIIWIERKDKSPDLVKELAKSEFPNTADPAPAFESSIGYSIAELCLSPSEPVALVTLQYHFKRCSWLEFKAISTHLEELLRLSL
ncbi:hypothetical protein Aperf_G00000048131 [Anoplocephala perfoliata]